jgi:hypothetical protein
MKLVIAIFLIVSSTIGYAKVSVHRLVIIYLDILNTNKIKNAPKLKVSSDKRWNARYNKEEHSIIINQGLLNADEDTIATTLGHELVHAKYGHINYLLQSRKVAYEQEYLADEEGKLLATRAGYNACKGFKWIYDQHITNDRTHPDSDDRYRKLGCLGAK